MSASPHASEIRSAQAALAAGRHWRWAAQVVRVLDGDTVECVYDIGLGLLLAAVPNTYVSHVRFVGYDAPDHDPDKSLATAALVEQVLPALPAPCFVDFVGLEAHGRLLGSLTLLDGRSVTDEMVQLGWLRPYNGHGPHPWP